MRGRRTKKEEEEKNNKNNRNTKEEIKPPLPNEFFEIPIKELSSQKRHATVDSDSATARHFSQLLSSLLSSAPRDQSTTPYSYVAKHYKFKLQYEEVSDPTPTSISTHDLL
jgi:hypothetical protein